MTSRTETRCVQLPLAPPRRLAPGARFRSFKTRDDRALWEQLMAPVETLRRDGWRPARATVDWGKTRPLAGAALSAWLVVMTRCPDVAWTWSGRGNGSTEICLER